MESKVYVIYNTEQSTDYFYNKYREFNQCNIQLSMKRYSESRDKLSNHREIYCANNRDVLLAKPKLNQQKINYERKIYKQKVEELKKR